MRFTVQVVWFNAGWWYTYPSEKYESQLGLLFPIYEKNTNQVGWFNEISWDLLAFNGTKKTSGVINGWKIPEHMEVYN